MFMVWDGNHRLHAWLPIINNEHKNDPSWHFTMESTILVVDGDTTRMLTALHEVNLYVMNPTLPFTFILYIHRLYWCRVLLLLP
jgi:hypothetical protein